MAHRTLAAGMMIVAAGALAGCAIRYGEAGVSRTGPFLWGFGDPPGVHWDLGEPRREIPELPPARRRELPLGNTPRGFDGSTAIQNPPDKTIATMDDNRARAPVSTVVPHPVRSDGRDNLIARR